MGTLVLAGSALGGLAPAQAQTFATTVVAPFPATNGVFTTTTSASSPVFDRAAITRGDISPKPTGKSGLGNAVAYATTTFTPTAAKLFTIQIALTGYGNDGTASDYVESLYSPSFSPTSLSTILQSYNPSATGGGSYTINLNANTPYVFVDHGYYNENDPSVNAHGPSTGTAKTTILDPGSTMYILNAGVTSGATESIVPQTITQTLNVTSTATISSFTGVSLAKLQHGYVGDLTATLTHGGVTVVLFDHTGASNNTFQGDPGSGAIFSASNTYTFAPTGSSLTSTPFGSVVPSGTYEATSNTAGGFDTTHTENTLNDFVGQKASGAWTLSVTNNQPGNTGSFVGFSFGINGSPAQ